MKYFISTLAVFLFLIQKSNAQSLPPNMPEQEPCHALEVCGNFHTSYSYQGHGISYDLPTTPCDGDEANSSWFKLTINTSGTLVFKIIPVVSTDDYDWALLDGTGVSCASLGYENVIRCNFNNNYPVSFGGQTGLNLSSTTEFVMAGTSGNNFNKKLEVTAGQVFYLMINNFGTYTSGTTPDPSAGFTLDFSGSTATFNAPPAPELQSIEAAPCKVIVHLNGDVKCTSIASNGSDFTITPYPGASITGAVGLDCAAGEGYSDAIQLNFSGNLNPGTYTLKAKIGTDGNTLLNLCDVPLALPDSLVFTIPKSRDTVTMEVCPGELPFVWNDINITHLGNAVATYTSITALGCDSFTTLNIKKADTIKVDENLVICTNQLPYNWHGQIFNLGDEGTHVATFYTLSALGCDSLTFLNLAITPPKVVTEELQICSYDLPYNWNGTIIPVGTTSTDNYDTFKTSTLTGCDSTTILNLTVHEITPISDVTNKHACGSFTFKGVEYHTDTVLADTLFSASGCDSVYLTMNIFVHYNEPSTYPNRIYGCDSLNFRGEVYYKDTVVADSIKTYWGCDSLLILNEIHIHHFDLEMVASADTIVAGEYVILNAQAGVPFEVSSWNPPTLFPNQKEYEQTIQPSSTQTFVVQGVSDYGCIDTGKKEIVVIPLVPDFLMPNAFSPNGDGVNDIFEPKFYHETGYVIRQFYIFNRWGELVYKLENSRVNGWNGKNSVTGKQADLGVYYYLIEVEFVNKQKVLKKGDVTLVK